MVKYVVVTLLMFLAGCTPDLNGEYHASRKILFFTQEATLTIQEDKATFTVSMPGMDKQATDAYLIKHGDGKIALYKADKPDDQLIFDILDDGQKLQYQKAGQLDLPEVWTKKIKI